MHRDDKTIKVTVIIFNFSINIYGANMKNDADMDELADKLMQRIYYQMQKRSINMNEGAV